MSIDDTLPNEVDVLILGTGLPESMIAAACARSGLSVLHIDRNDYYGDCWSSFNLHSINEWAERLSKQKDVEPEEDENTIVNIKSKQNEGEELILVGRNENIQNVTLQWHIMEADATESEQNGASEDDHSIRRDIEKHWRRFNIDILPKVLLSRGAMVQVICDSEVSKYCEFKCVNRLLCLSPTDDDNIANGGAITNLQVVPCSRSAIFQSEAITMIEKRRIMKFLTSCMQWHQNPDAIDGWSDFAERSFDEFVESRGMTGNLKNFVTDTIGILRPNANTKEGLEAVCRFMDSVGRFGDSPFLWTLYGGGELPQCFCRLCAVFGGTYCLKQPIDAFVCKENRIEAVITKGQRISCKEVIINSSFLPACYLQKDSPKKTILQRAVLLTNRSILTDPQKEHISLLNLMRLDADASARLLEVGFEACAAPRGYFVSHLSASSSEGSALETLKPIVSRLYKMSSSDADSEDPRPQLFWSLYFDMVKTVYKAEDLPTNLHVVSDVDAALDYDELIVKTKKLFEEVWTDRNFLPRSLAKENDDGEADEDAEELHSEGNPEGNQLEQQPQQDEPREQEEPSNQNQQEIVNEA